MRCGFAKRDPPTDIYIIYKHTRTIFKCTESYTSLFNVETLLSGRLPLSVWDFHFFEEIAWLVIIACFCSCQPRHYKRIHNFTTLLTKNLLISACTLFSKFSISSQHLTGNIILTLNSLITVSCLTASHVRCCFGWQAPSSPCKQGRGLDVKVIINAFCSLGTLSSFNIIQHII